MKHIGLALAGALLLPVPANAGSVLAQFGGSACYSRVYDKAHLAGHPDQTVRKVSLGRSSFQTGGGRTVLSVRVEFRGSGEVFSGDAYCTPRGDGATCGLEGDAGRFELSLRGKDLRMTVGEAFFEGEADGVAFGRDDKVFLLRRGRCI